MLINQYPINTRYELNKFFESYSHIVLNQIKLFGIDLSEYGIVGDHLGLQVLSNSEFDLAHDYIIKYAKIIKKGIIHDRRNNTYLLKDFIKANGIEIQSIEVFEPKPTADLSKLKPGFEHIAMKVEKFDELLDFFDKKKLPMDKFVELGDSKFFKTKFVNLVEIEFRNDYLWESLIESKI